MGMFLLLWGIHLGFHAWLLYFCTFGGSGMISLIMVSDSSTFLGISVICFFQSMSGTGVTFGAAGSCCNSAPQTQLSWLWALPPQLCLGSPPLRRYGHTSRKKSWAKSSPCSLPSGISVLCSLWSNVWKLQFYFVQFSVVYSRRDSLVTPLSLEAQDPYLRYCYLITSTFSSKRTSLVKNPPSSAGDVGSIPGRELRPHTTRSYWGPVLPLERCLWATVRSPPAATKTQHSRKSLHTFLKIVKF